MFAGEMPSSDNIDAKPEDQINPKLIFNTLKRNKVILASFSLAGLIISGCFAFTTKKTWQGEFQIVLSNETNPSKMELEARLAAIRRLTSGSGNFGKLNSQPENFPTEVEILKSPSVLMSVFEFAKKEKDIEDKSNSTMRFSDWIKNLDFNLKRGTSVLKIAYRNTDKDLILPILNKISKTYQDYSVKKKRRNIELGISFSSDQIPLYKAKWITSISDAQQFAVDQDLIFPKDGNDNLIILNRDDNGSLMKRYIDIENRRIKAANEIRLLNEKLAQIKLLIDPYQILYLASTNKVFDDLSKEIKQIDNQLNAKSRVNTNTKNDLAVKRLLKKRDYLNQLLKERAIGILKAQKGEALAQVKASELSKGVLIKYRNLLVNAAKNKLTLDNMEEQYRFFSLEKARYTDPWEIIKKPTLLPNPIAPNKKQILALGLLTGFFAGCGFSIALEKSKNIIFSVEEIQSIFKWQLLDTLSFKDMDLFRESLELLATGPLSSNEGAIALMPLGNINNIEMQKINKYLKKSLKDREIIITKQIVNSTSYPSILLIAKLGITSKKELSEVCRRLDQRNNKVLGILVLKETIKKNNGTNNYQ